MDVHQHVHQLNQTGRTVVRADRTKFIPALLVGVFFLIGGVAALLAGDDPIIGAVCLIVGFLAVVGSWGLTAKGVSLHLDSRGLRFVPDTTPTIVPWHAIRGVFPSPVGGHPEQWWYIAITRQFAQIYAVGRTEAFKAHQASLADSHDGVLSIPLPLHQTLNGHAVREVIGAGYLRATGVPLPTSLSEIQAEEGQGA